MDLSCFESGSIHCQIQGNLEESVEQPYDLARLSLCGGLPGSGLVEKAFPELLQALLNEPKRIHY